MVNDVEKRWSDPRTFRHAAWYVVAVLVTTVVAVALTMTWAGRRSECSDADTALCDTMARTVVGLGPGGVLLLGGIGAFVMTFLQWRRRRNWVIWQGAGWFLFTLMVVFLSIAGGAR
ncbi:hypothetical protein HLB23_12695 [Nocardia uniformis]|uniref:Uncharacterized protein n=1 Tax=Nocardia uniformis TaxID=53432 RepID=A0A849BVU5_9NOCA|nr:hypothetical protein [Nocardia uniformis]NNH70713.1 hypothetical protein [Nocardia uniformis]